MRNRCNSQQLQSVPQLKEVIHQLQQKDASLRLDNANLKKQLMEKNQLYLDSLKQISELKKIQKRDNQYFLKIDEYVTNLRKKLHKANQKINLLETKCFNASQRESQIFKTETSTNQSDQKPKQFKINIKPLIQPYPNISYTENSDIFEDSTSEISKPNTLQEQIMHRILDKQDTVFTCNSQQSNFSFAQSDKKRTENQSRNSYKQQQYNSLSTSYDDKENQRFYNY